MSLPTIRIGVSWDIRIIGGRPGHIACEIPYGIIVSAFCKGQHGPGVVVCKNLGVGGIC
jgi:hypothetical protein